MLCKSNLEKLDSVYKKIKKTLGVGETGKYYKS